MFIFPASPQPAEGVGAASMGDAKIMRATAARTPDVERARGHARAAPSSQVAALAALAPPRLGQNVTQRKACACGGGCPRCQSKPARPAATPTGRAGAPQDAAHGEAAAPVGPGGGPLPTGMREYLSSSAATGDPLDGGVRGDLERSFGRPLGGVRLIRDEAARRAAAALEARAFTLGDSIWFGRGEYRPETHEGRRLIAHEVAHSLQDAARGGRVFTDLVVGPSDDPAEREADNAADAAVRGERATLSTGAAGSVRALRMQRIGCTASAATLPNQRIVTCPSGVYKVTLTTIKLPRGPETQSWTDAGWNNNEIWLRIGVCRGGTSVTVTPSVDLPRAVIQALGNVLAGSGALSGVTLTGGLRIQVIQSSSFTLTLTPAVTVDPSSGSVTGVGGGVTVQTRDVTVGGQVTVDPRSGSTFLTFTLSEGVRQPPVDCTGPRERLVLECRPITHIPGRPAVPEITEQDYETRYLFFNYMQDTIAPDFQSRPPRRGRAPSVDLRERIATPTDIQELNDAGYRITSIEGFTSPEGTRAASRGFEGNVELGRRRAVAARDWVLAQCPTCVTPTPTVVDCSELPTEQCPIEPEQTGRSMERGAVRGFLGTDPLSPSDPETRAEFERLPGREQREQVFELQRRAVIRFYRERVVQSYRPPEGERDEPGERVRCPSEVAEAARTSFGITIF